MDDSGCVAGLGVHRLCIPESDHMTSEALFVGGGGMGL